MLREMKKWSVFLLAVGICLTGSSSPSLAADTAGASKADTAALAAPAEKSFNIFGDAVRKEVPAGESEEVVVTLPAVPQGKPVMLVLKARVNNATISGFSPVMQIQVNGKALSMAQLKDRKTHFSIPQGTTDTLQSNGAFTLYYAPDFTPIPQDSPYYSADVPGSDPFTFKFDLTKLAKEGPNVITFTNALDPARPGAPKMIIEDARLSGVSSLTPGGAVKADAGEAAGQSFNVFGTVMRKEVHPGAADENAVTLPAIPEGKTVLLVLKARMYFAELAGCSPFLQVRVNGKLLTMDQVKERKARFTLAQGDDIPTLQGDNAFTLFYAPNFHPIPEDNHYYPVDLPGNDPFTFKFDVTKLVKEGNNIISFRNVGEAGKQPPVPNMIVEAAKLVIQ